MIDKLTIYIDVDDTTTELIKHFIDVYNKIYQDDISKSDITDWNISNFLKPECGECWYKLLDRSLIKNAQPLPNAVEYITRLMREENVYFLSAVHPTNVLYRHEKLASIFDTYTYENLISCSHKELLCGDILIDDGIHNFKGIGKTIKHGVLVSQPWNLKETKLQNGLKRSIADWEHIYNHIQDIKNKYFN